MMIKNQKIFQEMRIIKEMKIKKQNHIFKIKTIIKKENQTIIEIVEIGIVNLILNLKVLLKQKVF